MVSVRQTTHTHTHTHTAISIDSTLEARVHSCCPKVYATRPDKTATVNPDIDSTSGLSRAPQAVVKTRKFEGTCINKSLYYYKKSTTLYNCDDDEYNISMTNSINKYGTMNTHLHRAHIDNCIRFG